MIAREALPLVNNTVMNDAHLTEIKLINDLLNCLDDDADFDVITYKVEGILKHMQEHFAEEERMMQARGYPSFGVHKAEHDRTLGEVQFACMDWRTRKERRRLRRFFGEDIVDWIDLHIKSMDAPAAAFLSLNASMS